MLSAIMALMSGGTIVLNRVLNAEMGTRKGIWSSTLFNYITGLATSLLLVLIARAWLQGPLPSAWYLYTGGLIGVIVVAISSIAAPHLPVFLMTLLMFVSQFIAGMIIDAATGRATPALKMIGAAIVLIGLLTYVLGERNASIADGRKDNG